MLAASIGANARDIKMEAAIITPPEMSARMRR
jgi:hypothetical protein